MFRRRMGGSVVLFACGAFSEVLAEFLLGGTSLWVYEEMKVPPQCFSPRCVSCTVNSRM